MTSKTDTAKEQPNTWTQGGQAKSSGAAAAMAKFLSVTTDTARGPGGRGGESMSIRELTQRQYNREVQVDQEQGRKSRTYPEFLESKGLLGLKARIEREADQCRLTAKLNPWP